jgi:cytochrome b6-f complex iron-sulfur subunit
VAVKKPSPQKEAAAGSAVEVPERRSFLYWLWGGLGLAAAAEAVWMALSFLRHNRAERTQRGAGLWIDAGPVHAFAPNTVAAFPRGRFYLSRLPDGGFLALSRRCTHLGCTIPWNAESGRFECPCHASVFDIRGEVLRSPAQRALDIHPVTIENELVRVDTGRVVQRSAFRPEQVVHPR